MPPVPLSLIIAYARAGASAFAWERFVAAGYGRMTQDPAALNVKGRLLKDRALAHSGAERRRLYAEAAEAYRAAAAAAGASTYPLINAASLSLLAGDAARARDLAGQVCEHVEAHPDEPETPYWRAATRAEALLLLDREPEARAALAEAVALAPLAWEDHASTLRQFGLILAAQGRDAAWLDAYRPPRSLHFGGHMSFDSKVARREHLDETIRAVLEEERIGFGYGALAAGADIIVAEALLERGAELHAVLPGGPEAFAAVSVDPFGKAWRRRFDAVLGRAGTVRGVRPLGIEPGRAMVGLGDEIAMGAAVMNARRLESRAMQLLVLPDEAAEPGRAAPRAGALWAEAGWRQRIVTAPREALPPGEPPRLRAGPHRRLAVLAIMPGEGDGLAERLAAIAPRLAGAGAAPVPPYFTGREILFAYAEPVEAALAALAFARASAASPAAGIGCHYGIADPVDDPFSGRPRLAGEAPALAAAAAASAPPGSVCVSGDFAAALAATGGTAIQAELAGELSPPPGEPPVELYTLTPRL
ncbi:MAG TPA: tetratricopeptide repeat-containing protein [Allosphingosinicella sp.]|jgi:hypothetical protein